MGEKDDGEREKRISADGSGDCCSRSQRCSSRREVVKRPGVVREAHASTFESVACLASGLAPSASDRFLRGVYVDTMKTTKIQAYAAHTASSALAPFGIARREAGPTDVEIDILFCGVCHSDLHQARNEWHNTIYPCVPGHEIVGRVTRVGSRVSKFKPGDLSAVGCMVDSCRTCSSCRAGFEQ